MHICFSDSLLILHCICKYIITQAVGQLSIVMLNTVKCRLCGQVKCSNSKKHFRDYNTDKVLIMMTYSLSDIITLFKHISITLSKFPATIYSHFVFCYLNTWMEIPEIKKNCKYWKMFSEKTSPLTSCQVNKKKMQITYSNDIAGSSLASPCTCYTVNCDFASYCHVCPYPNLNYRAATNLSGGIFDLLFDCFVFKCLKIVKNSHQKASLELNVTSLNFKVGLINNTTFKN